MGDFWKGYLLGWILPLLAALYNWLRWHLERREKKAERAAKERAEAELALIRRRATGPFLRPNLKRFNFLYYDSKRSHEVGFRPMGRGDMLDAITSEIADSVPAGHWVYFVIENVGEATRESILRLDGLPILLHREPDISDANNLFFISYAFDPNQKGNPQTLEVEFLSETGVRDTHKYYTEHGKRILRRTDPT